MTVNDMRRAGKVVHQTEENDDEYLSLQVRALYVYMGLYSLLNSTYFVSIITDASVREANRGE
jgi:hypothetical protein